MTGIDLKIKALREKKGYSQAELARRAGIAQSTLSYIESGKKSPTAHTLNAVCNGLNVSMLELLTSSQIQKRTRMRLKSPDQKTGLLDEILDNIEDLGRSHIPMILNARGIPEEAVPELEEFLNFLYIKYNGPKKNGNR